MKRKLIGALAVLAIASTAFAGGLVQAHKTEPASMNMEIAMLRLEAQMAEAGAASNSYVGTTMCMACHDEPGFYDTQHAMAMIRPMTKNTLTKKKGILAHTTGFAIDDFMAGVDFNKVKSDLDAFKPYAPSLGVRDGVYTFTINEVEMPVLWVRQQFDREGNWIQRFGVKIPVTDQASGYAGATYLAGIQYETRHEKWVLDGVEDVYGASGPKIKPNMTTADVLSCGLESFDRNCVGCHVSGIKSLKPNSKGEYVFKGYPTAIFNPDDPNAVDYDGDGLVETVNIGCESCHGPGAQHVLAKTDADRRAKIVNLENLSQAEQLAVCGQCHSRIKSVPAKLFSWPYNETTSQQWVPGMGPMEPFYTENFSVYPDGWNGRGTHSQFNEALKKGTKHFNNPYEKMSCWTCHTLHRNVATSQTRTSLTVQDGGTSLRIATSTKDNTLCLACHAGYGPFASLNKGMIAKYKDNLPTIAAVTSKHTFHPYGPEREMGISRCTTCHMPYKGTIPGTTEYYVAGHTWDPMSPEKSLNPAYLAKGGQPSSCAVQCHAQLVNIFKLGIIEELPATTKWTGSFEKMLAEVLVKFYGPKGTWWNTTPPPAK